MNVLFIAPQPFYEERGTPIAVDLILRVLSERGEKVDLVTYHLGKDVHYENINIHRMISVPFIQIVSPGFSFKKVICDIFLFWKVIFMVTRVRFDVIHAVEESVLVAFILKKLCGIDYIYDMDSRLSKQMIDKFPYLRPIAAIIYFVERLVIQNATILVPVSEALVEDIMDDGFDNVIILHDVPLPNNINGEKIEPIRKELGISGLLIMYVGNLESYQGIDLLLESFALIEKQSELINLAIIGGQDKDIQKYERKSRDFGIKSRVRFLGPRPVKNLSRYLSEADILVSPRILGENTPMKIYSYLESGKAIIATNLRTHTQVLDDKVALLVAPTPKSFAQGMRTLADDEALRKELGNRGKKLIQEKYNFQNFKTSVNHIYDCIAPQQSD